MGIVRRKTFSTRDGEITFLSFSVESAAPPTLMLAALAESERQVGLRNVVRQAVFLSRSADRPGVEVALAEAYGAILPATSYVHQPSADGAAVAVELWAFGSGGAVRQLERITLASMGTVTWAFVGRLETAEDEKPYEGVHRTLRAAQQELEKAGLEFGQLVRTWYYVGNILGRQDSETRYQRVNRARNEFYRENWPDLCHSPASTGIGMGTNQVVLEAFALGRQRDRPEVKWIHNPLQTPPYLYETQADQDSNPSFSRAAAVGLRHSVVLLVSGTASVRGSEALSPGDPAAQTEVTIENIATLIGDENLVGNYGFCRGATVEDIHQFRVYVKRPGDVRTVRDCCRRHLPDAPCAYLIADICIPDCLVEIEAVAAFKR